MSESAAGGFIVVAYNVWVYTAQGAITGRWVGDRGGARDGREFAKEEAKSLFNEAIRPTGSSFVSFRLARAVRTHRREMERTCLFFFPSRRDRLDLSLCDFGVKEALKTTLNTKKDDEREAQTSFVDGKASKKGPASTSKGTKASLPSQLLSFWCLPKIDGSVQVLTSSDLPVTSLEAPSCQADEA